MQKVIIYIEVHKFDYGDIFYAQLGNNNHSAAMHTIRKR